MTRHVVKMTLYVVPAPFEINHSMCVLSRIDGSGIDQQDRDVVLTGINAAAHAALETFPILFQDERLLANRADEDVEKILGNHDAFIVTPKDIGRSPDHPIL